MQTLSDNATGVGEEWYYSRIYMQVGDIAYHCCCCSSCMWSSSVHVLYRSPLRLLLLNYLLKNCTRTECSVCQNWPSS